MKQRRLQLVPPPEALPTLEVRPCTSTQLGQRLIRVAIRLGKSPESLLEYYERQARQNEENRRMFKLFKVGDRVRWLETWPREKVRFGVITAAYEREGDEEMDAFDVLPDDRWRDDTVMLWPFDDSMEHWFDYVSDF